MKLRKTAEYFIFQPIPLLIIYIFSLDIQIIFYTHFLFW